MSAGQVIVFILFPLAGYLLGSVPFAWVIGKANGVDIRTVGSKNIGATNLGRTLGKRFFWYAFLLDAAKGFVPVLAVVLLVSHMRGPPVLLMDGHMVPGGWDNGGNLAQAEGLPLPRWAPLLTGIACVVGHLFPIWLKFKGGKGVATGFGAVLGFWPLYTIAGLLAGLLFIFMLMVYRYISLASMTGGVGFAILVAALGRWNNRWVSTYQSWDELRPQLVVACLFALSIIIRHRGNISRLLKGTEPQIGQREIDKAKLEPHPKKN